MTKLIKINKRAQMETQWFIFLVIAVVFGILAVLWFTGTFEKLGIFGKAVPDDFATVAATCTQEAGIASFKADYCGYGSFKEVTMGGERQRVNCLYLSSIAKFDNQNTECDETQVAINAKNTCASTTLKLKPTYKINGKTCSEWNATVIAVAGTCVDKATNPCTGLGVKVCAPADAICTWSSAIAAEDETIACQLNEAPDANGKIGCAKLTETSCKSATYSSLCDWNA